MQDKPGSQTDFPFLDHDAFHTYFYFASFGKRCTGCGAYPCEAAAAWDDFQVTATADQYTAAWAAVSAMYARHFSDRS